MTDSPRLMVVALQSGGHNPNFVQWLIEYCAERQLPVRLDVLVTPSFIHSHPFMTGSASNWDCGGSRFVAITPEEHAWITYQASPFFRGLAALPKIGQHLRLRFRRYREWQLCRNYALSTGVDHCLFLNFDFYQLFPAIGMKLSCPFSGVYHNPHFHYRRFGADSPASKQRLRSGSQRQLMARVMSHPESRTIFCLDPYLVEELESPRLGARVVFLPTPVKLYSAGNATRESQLREELQIETGRRVFLLLGGVSARRGVYQLLAAVRLLSPSHAARICILLVGRHADRAALAREIELVRQTTQAQIVSRDEFVPEPDIEHYYRLADVVVATHQRHVGVSVTLVYAAATRKPVLASDYGLLGETVRRHSMGLAVEARDPRAIAAGLVQFLDRRPDLLFDPDQTEIFAASNTLDQYAATLLQHTLGAQMTWPPLSHIPVTS